EWIWLWSQDLQTLELALALAQRAVALDDSLPIAHTLLGYVSLFKKQHKRAIAEGEQAIVLDPNFAWGYALLAEILTFVGRPEEALGLAEKTMRLDPQAAAFYSFQVGHAYRLMGRYGEALTAFKRVLTGNLNPPATHRHLAVIYSELGREAEARAEAAEVLRRSPNFSLEDFKHRLPYEDPVAVERYLAGLRKAGLK